MRFAPPLPEFQSPRRARYCVLVEGDKDERYTGRGWVSFAGQWVHVHDDDHDMWQSWPCAHVLWIEWDGSASTCAGNGDGHDIRQRDGARKQCPEHPDSQLEQGFTMSGQLKTWCTEPGCFCLAEWVPQEADQ